MKAISRWLDRFCYKHPNFGVPELMKYIALGNVAVYVLDVLTNYSASMMLMFRPDLILQGQVWRLVTFVFVSGRGGSGFINVLFFLISTFFYYQIGTALEHQWQDDAETGGKVGYVSSASVNARLICGGSVYIANVFPDGNVFLREGIDLIEDF